MGVGRLAGQLAGNLSPSDESDALYHAGSLYQHAKDVVAWTHFMADVIEQGSFNAKELRQKLAMGYVGTSEARDILGLRSRRSQPRRPSGAGDAGSRALGKSADTQYRRIDQRGDRSGHPGGRGGTGRHRQGGDDHAYRGGSAR